MFRRRDLTVSKGDKKLHSKNDLFQNIQLFNYSRDALRLILKIKGVTSQCEVLVPQVLCDTVVNVIAEFTEKIIFYQIESNYAINEKNIIESITDRTKVIILVDYFGIYRAPSKKLIRILKSRKVVTVHDAAHGFLNFVHKRGYFAVEYDFTIVSVYKNVPWHIGAFLVGTIDDKSNLSLCLYLKRQVINHLKTLLLSTFLKKEYAEKAIKFTYSELRREEFKAGSLLVNWYLNRLRTYSFDDEVKVRKKLSQELLTVFNQASHYNNILTSEEVEDSVLMAYPVLADSISNRNKLILALLDKGIDAYTWPTYSSKNIALAQNETLVLIPFSEDILKKVQLCLTT